MNTQNIIRRFSDIVNTGLSNHLNTAIEARTELEAEDPELVLQLIDHFQHAYQPSTFYNHRVVATDSYFEQCYQLMSNIFEPDVVDPKDILKSSYTQPFTDVSSSILIGRFWETLGLCEYDDDGKLVFFHYDPLSVTRHIAGMINGNYMSFDTKPLSMAGIGQLATRPAHRQQRHGSNLVNAFESTATHIATRLNENLQLIVLESEERARAFWTKMGFLYPQPCEYMQPPLDYDLETGDPYFQPVAEMLMIKRLDMPEVTHIATDLLLNVVHTLYERWYMPDEASEIAIQRIESLVFGNLFEQFKHSLQANGDITQLIKPV